jgi:hypothetical protein
MSNVWARMTEVASRPVHGMIAAVQREERRQEVVAALNPTGRLSLVQLIVHSARIYVAPFVGVWEGLLGRGVHRSRKAVLPTSK